MGLLKHAYWVAENLYARLFARPWMAGFHMAMLTFALHGLGYDNIYSESFTGEEWFITSVLKKAKVRYCLDIGANVGSYSTMLVDALGCSVHAIEPSESSFRALEQCPGVLSGTVTPHRLALADFTGEATLYSRSERAVTATLDGSVLKGTSTSETVPVTTVDTLCETIGVKEFDLIKIDVEGYEREVLRGMEKTLRNHPPRFIQFEFNIMQLYRGYTLLSLAELLPGYEFYRLLPRGWMRIDPRKFSSNIFMYSNIIAVRP